MNNMVIFQVLIVFAVFQVSTTFRISNTTTVNLNSVSSSSSAYKVIAFTEQYLSSVLNIFEDEGESLIGEMSWHIKESFNAEKDVSFYLHTRINKDIRKELRLNDSQSLKVSGFNSLHPTRIIIHGWLGSEFARVFFSLTPAYLKNGNYNVIHVDWGRGAIADYTTASRRVKSVGVIVAKFVDFLHEESGTQIENIHLIGFSMGAHIAGIAGKHIINGQIAVIYGLDPALPLFNFKDTKVRLSTEDAEYVEVIHSNAGGYGFEKAIGHADFYLNYGNNQPGCILEECNHFRSFKVFAESINSKIGFWARGCDSSFVDDLLSNRKCYHPTSDRALLGGNSTRKYLKGVFYLKTNFEPPYAKGKTSN